MPIMSPTFPVNDSHQRGCGARISCSPLASADATLLSYQRQSDRAWHIWRAALLYLFLGRRGILVGAGRSGRNECREKQEGDKMVAHGSNPHRGVLPVV